MHVDRAKVQRSTHLVVEACVAYGIVGGFVSRRCGATRAVWIDQVAGEALSEELGVWAHELCRQPRSADEGEQRLRAAADDLVGRSMPVWECHFHGLWSFRRSCPPSTAPISTY